MQALGGHGSSGPRDHGYIISLAADQYLGHCFYKVQHVSQSHGTVEAGPKFLGGEGEPVRLGKSLGREAQGAHK